MEDIKFNSKIKRHQDKKDVYELLELNNIIKTEHQIDIINSFLIYKNFKIFGNISEASLAAKIHRYIKNHFVEFTNYVHKFNILK